MNKKKQDGITLIALVITVIVIMIVAGISIIMLNGDNSILSRAGEAKERTEDSDIQDKIRLAYTATNIEGKGIPDYDKFRAELAKEFGTEGTDWKISKSSSNPWVVTVYKGTRSIQESINVAESSLKGDLVIPDELEIGDTVTWTPTGSTYTLDADYYASDDTYEDLYYASGTAYTNLSSSDKANYQDMTISSWKVLSIDRTNNKITLIPTDSTMKNNQNETPSAGGGCWAEDYINSDGYVVLQGAQGYNNGVYLLNDMCDKLYSDSSVGATARSINIEDIENAIIASGNGTDLENAKSHYDYGSKTLYANNTTYRDTTTGAYIYNKSYPEIFAQEVDSSINGTSTGGTLGLSKQTSLIGRTNTSSNGIVGAITATTSIGPKQTYYYFDAYLGDMLSNDYSVLANTSYPYWVASRCANLDYYYANFGVRSVKDGSLHYYDLFYSIVGTNDDAYGLFPVITLSSGVLSESGSGYALSSN